MLKRKTLLAALLMGMFALLVIGCSRTQKPASQIYKNAEIITVKGEPVPGKISVVKIKSTELSQTELEDWYYNYAKPAVAEKKFNSCIIAYTDKENLGVTYQGTTLTKDITVNLSPQTISADKTKCEGTIIVETDGGKYLKPLKFG